MMLNSIAQADSLDNWNSQNSGTSSSLFKITYANNTFVAVGADGVILTSPDAVTWTRQSSGYSGSLRGITYANGTFVAVGNDGVILTSPDAVTWTSQSAFSGACITYANNTFVVVGGDGILTSPDAENWTSQRLGFSSRNQALNRIIYANNTFVAVGGGPLDGTIITSPDAVAWTIQEDKYPNYLKDLTYANGTFVAVGIDGIILTSPDAKTWTCQRSGYSDTLQSITYANDTFVAVGFRTILTSPDGKTWTKRSTGALQNLYNVTYANNTFAAVGIGGAILTSTNSKPVVPIKVLINSVPQTFPQPPVMINNRVMVPLRGIFEALGAEVKWDPQTQAVKATKGSTTIELKIGDSTAYKNGQSVTLEPPPQIVNGSTMVPVRFVSEALGAEVKWDGATQTVNIFTSTNITPSGLLGNYYQYFKNTDKAESELRFQRIDPNINFDSSNKVFNDYLISNKYKVIWDGFIKAPKTGVYTFTAEADDGIQLRIGNVEKPQIDKWSDGDHSGWFAPSFKISLEAGKTYPLYLAYFQSEKESKIKIYWEITSPEGNTAKEIIPASAFTYDPDKIRSDVPVIE